MSSFDEKWNQIYRLGQQLNKYPYDEVVSFLFSNYSHVVNKSSVSILEVGCGGGNNLWFAAKEGFSTYGMDASHDAIEFARTRFKEEGLNSVFEVKRFEEISQINPQFDCVIDRCALTHTPFSYAQEAIAQIHGRLKKDGKLFFNCFAEQHTSAKNGVYDSETQYTTNIKKGSLQGVGGVCFYNNLMLEQLFNHQLWHIERKDLMIKTDTLNNEQQAQWIIVVQKND